MRIERDLSYACAADERNGQNLVDQDKDDEFCVGIDRK